MALPASHPGSPGCLCREAGHHELADRLVEIQYELTDRLAFYLCGRRPGTVSAGNDGLFLEVDAPRVQKCLVVFQIIKTDCTSLFRRWSTGKREKLLGGVLATFQLC